MYGENVRPSNTFALQENEKNVGRRKKFVFNIENLTRKFDIEN